MNGQETSALSEICLPPLLSVMDDVMDGALSSTSASSLPPSPAQSSADTQTESTSEMSSPEIPVAVAAEPVPAVPHSIPIFNP